MKSINTVLTIALVTTILLSFLPSEAHAERWGGVDESVIENVAEEAGREPAEPLINTDQGDLLLFVFLLAGTVGGFVGGYYYHKLFVAQTHRRDNAS